MHAYPSCLIGASYRLKGKSGCVVFVLLSEVLNMSQTPVKELAGVIFCSMYIDTQNQLVSTEEKEKI